MTASGTTEEAPEDVLVTTEGAHYRAVALAAGRPTDVLTAPVETRGAVGSIYVGRVVRHMPGLKAAFVEIGLDRPAFLNLDKTTPPAGKPALVQIVESAEGDKAPRLSRRIALMGRYLILLPYERGVVVSRRLDQKIQANLGGYIRKLVHEGAVIVRAAAARADGDTLAGECVALQALWTEIAARTEATPPACVHVEHPLRRLLRELGRGPKTCFIFDDAEAARIAREVAPTLGPDLAARIETAPAGTGVLDRDGIAEALASVEAREVPLATGGRLTIERTAALTAIDVDTGPGSADPRAVVETNLEAARETARQLRLRDIGGLVVIDFIRMPGRTDRNRVLATLQRAVDSDPRRVQVLGWTAAGLVELIRSRADAGAE